MPSATRRLAASLACLLLLAEPARAQADPTPGSLGTAPLQAEDARVLPVLARHGMVSSQEAHATRIGVDILKRGGNAVDAAVAVGFALAVTLPRAGNLGGGGFMLVHLAERDETIAIDFRETAPGAATADMFLGADGQPDKAASTRTGKAVGVPGSVRGFAEAHRRYGSQKFSLAELIAPAEALARGGIPVESGLADSLPRASGLLGRWPSSRAIFFAGDQILKRGDILVQRDLADTLHAIAERGP
ncbi:MAG: gamma-glutamyltransferase, partial [Methylobacterium sp.]